MWPWLLLLWADAARRARASTDLREIWANANYRFRGHVEGSPLTAQEIAKLLFFGPIRDLQVGERPPYRFSFKVTPNRSARFRMPFRFKDPIGNTVVIDDIQEIATRQVQV